MRKTKQLISWDEETKTVGVIGACTEDEAEERLAQYTKERAQALFDVSEEEAARIAAEGNEYVYINRDALTAEIVYYGGEYSEHAQVVALPEADASDEDEDMAGTLVDVTDEDEDMAGTLVDVTDEDEDMAGTLVDVTDEEFAPHRKDISLVAYTDGSYNKETGYYGAGIVIFKKDSGEPPALHMSKGRAPEGENGWQVNGEIAAAEFAINEAIKAGAKSLEIHYDYEGVGKWATGKWKRNKSYTREYAEYVRSASEKLSITFVHVKGHSGDEWNDTADYLARKACGLAD